MLRNACHRYFQSSLFGEAPGRFCLRHVSFFVVALAIVFGISCGVPEGPVRIIIDTDLRSDVDDAGTLALAHALADNGACELIGVIASQTGPYIVGAIDAINTWYGRGHVPIGLSPVDDQRFRDPYAPYIGDPDNFPSSQTNETATESTLLYRRLLNESADGSVKIVVVGGQTPLHLLLTSGIDYEGDGSINRSGFDLVSAKVKGLYIMAGNFVDGSHREHNIALDLDAAQYIAANWPTYIVYSGFEIGRYVITGGGYTDPHNNPVAMAYKLYPSGGVGHIGGSASYDQTILYYSILGNTSNGLTLWDVAGPGTVGFPDGETHFTPNEEGRHYYLVANASFEVVADVIERLMLQPPVRRP